MKPTDILKEEHRVIEKVINGTKKICDGIQKGGDVPKELLIDIVDFIRTFADKCHHGKEEDRLFPVAEENGIPKDGPIGVMLNEHDMGRNYVKNLDEAIKTANKEKIVENALGYATLLTDHIYKEDNILYPMIDNVLSEETQKSLLLQFEEVEKTIGKDVHEKYHKFAKELEVR